MKQFGIYIHWPFCEFKCPYCDFNSHVEESIDEGRWLAAYLSELNRYANTTSKRTVTSIFFGGGTPSLMGSETLGEIIKAISDRWNLCKNAEITLEANPSSAEKNKFIEFKQNGVTRLSLGVQSLDEDSLLFLGRKHSVLEAKEAAILASEVFDRFSLDVIYGLPGQSPTKWKRELEEIFKLVTTHISAYQLTIEPGTQFYRDKVQTGGEAVEKKMFDFTYEFLEKKNLNAYEISNFAKPGHECLHNCTYWNGDDYLGIGPGSHGRITKPDFNYLGLETYATLGIKSPKKWLENVEEKGSGDLRASKLKPSERIDELVICGLRMAKGLDTGKFFSQTGISLYDVINKEKLLTFKERGWVKQNKDTLFLTHKGRSFLNYLAVDLLA